MYLNECISDMKLTHPTKWTIGLELGFFLSAMDFIGDRKDFLLYSFVSASFSIFFSIV